MDGFMPKSIGPKSRLVSEIFKSPGDGPALQSPVDSRAKLPQETDIIVREEAQVGNAVAHDRNPLDAEAEGVTGVFLRVIADLLEHRRVDHAATANLQPFAALDLAARARAINLEAPLREREEMGPKAELQALPQQFAEEIFEGPLQVAQRHSLVNDKPLHLEERHPVRRVDLVAAIAPARRNDPDRRRLLQHGVNLYRGSLRPHQAASAHALAVQSATR